MTYDQRDDVILPQYVIEQFSELTAGRVHHDHRRRPAPDVGRAVDPVQASAHLDHLGRAWARWASACRPRWVRQAAFPDALVVDIDGDGSFLMNIQELATLSTARSCRSR